MTREKRIANAIYHQHIAANLAEQSRRDDLPALYRRDLQRHAAWHYAQARFYMEIWTSPHDGWEG